MCPLYNVLWSGWSRGQLGERRFKMKLTTSADALYYMQESREILGLTATARWQPPKPRASWIMTRSSSPCKAGHFGVNELHDVATMPGWEYNYKAGTLPPLLKYPPSADDGRNHAEAMQDRQARKSS